MAHTGWLHALAIFEGWSGVREGFTDVRSVGRGAASNPSQSASMGSKADRHARSSKTEPTARACKANEQGQRWWGRLAG